MPRNLFPLARRALKELVTVWRSPRKRAAFNSSWNTHELYRQRLRLRSYPTQMILNPSTVCNLACPLCATGIQSANFPKEILAPEAFEAIMSHVRIDLLFGVQLFHWGEPLLNPHLAQYIRDFHERGVVTTVSSNLSTAQYDEDFLESLVRSGLDFLIASVDGATQEVYQVYRVGGDLARVVENMRRIYKVKQRLQSSTPTVFYRMLLNRFNETQAEQARQMAEEVGATFWPDPTFGIPPEVYEHWVADSVKAAFGERPATIYGFAPRRLIHTECRQLWDTLVVSPRGDILPCCVVADQEWSIGNVLQDPLEKVWNNEKRQILRRYVTDAKACAPGFPNMCSTCSHRFCVFPN